MSSEPVGLAVFGAGRIGLVHVANAAGIEGAELVGIADTDRAAATRAAERYGGRVDAVTSFLSDDRVRGIVIATPTGSHAELVMQAAAAGKHIFCEKPISLDIPTTRAAIATVDRARVILQVGFQRRFDEQFVRARRSVELGELGTPRLIRLVGRDHRVPPFAYLKTSGGQFKDQMIHEFDLAAWLFGPARIVEVYAMGSAIVAPALREFGDADTTVATLRFDSGALGVIDGSREAVYGHDVRAELVGTKGMLLVGHERFTNPRLFDASTVTPDVESFIERFERAYRAELEQFVQAIVLGRSPAVGGTDALEALRLASAATRSFAEGRPVKLSEIALG